MDMLEVCCRSQRVVPEQVLIAKAEARIGAGRLSVFEKLSQRVETSRRVKAYARARVAEDDGGAGLELNSKITAHNFLEAFPKWFYHWLPAHYHKEDVQLLGEIQKAKFVRLDEEQLLNEQLAMPHELISYKLIIVFCQICMMEEEKDVEAGLDEIARLARGSLVGNLFTEEVEKGLMHLFNVLHYFKDHTYCDDEELALRAMEPEDFIRSYAKLGRQARLSVKATQALFLGCCRNFEKQIRLAEEVVKRDPKTLEWSISLLMIYKMDRRERSRDSGPIPPRHEEWQLLKKCLAIHPKNIMVQALRMTMVADCFRSKMSFPLDLTDTIALRFETAAEVMEYIGSEARWIRDQRPLCVRINMFIVEAVTKGLPNEFRDNDLAKECLKNALSVNPKSSKANHQMAVILIREKRYDEARDYVRSALNADIRNDSAFMDCMHLLMKNVRDNEKEINDLLERREGWASSDIKLAMTYALKGVFLYVSNRLADAFNQWVLAYGCSKNEPGNTLNCIDRTVARFRWDREVISNTRLLKFFTDTLVTNGATVDKVLSPEETECVEVVIALLKANDPNKVTPPFSHLPGSPGRGGRNSRGENGPQRGRGRGRGRNEAERGRGNDTPAARARHCGIHTAGRPGRTGRRADADEEQAVGGNGDNEVRNLSASMGGLELSYLNFAVEQEAGDNQPNRLQNLVHARGQVPAREREQEPMNLAPAFPFRKFRGRGRGRVDDDDAYP